jgi:hypothetical protein
MSVSTLDSSDAFPLCLDEAIEWWDPDTECTLVASMPEAAPQLWDEYVDGARDSYRRHGVERALDLESPRNPADSSLFLAAVDSTGRIGRRPAKGPYRSAEESHAVVEWSGHPGRPCRKMISDRIPFGVVEVKTAWVTNDPARNRSLYQRARPFSLHSALLLDAKSPWRRVGTYCPLANDGRGSGGHVPATPYPDERYQTKMMWWDRSTFRFTRSQADHANSVGVPTLGQTSGQGG